MPKMPSLPLSLQVLETPKVPLSFTKEILYKVFQLTVSIGKTTLTLALP
jgi:hypothetical protein